MIHIQAECVMHSIVKEKHVHDMEKMCNETFLQMLAVREQAENWERRRWDNWRKAVAATGGGHASLWRRAHQLHWLKSQKRRWPINGFICVEEKVTKHLI